MRLSPPYAKFWPAYTAYTYTRIYTIPKWEGGKDFWWTQARVVVLHAAPTKYKSNQMGRWIEEDNANSQTIGICWLTQEHRRVGKRVVVTT